MELRDLAASAAGVGGPVKSSRRAELAERFGVTGALALVSLTLAFWQRPHGIFSDTRVEMVTDPGLFLGRITELWTSTIDLGHIQTSQFVGYLFPMGPFFAGGDAVGLPLWMVQRLWIALLLMAGAWGVVRLIDALRPTTGRISAFIAGLLYLASPFVTVSLNRGTIWLIPYALLPWMLLATRRGIDRPTGWIAPAAMALMVTACSAGVTPLFWVIVAVILLGIFESVTGPGLRPVASFAWRAALLSLLASLWWIVPVLAQARYGADYLTFTEHPEAILHTPSASESLRLLGYWVAYVNGYPDSDPQIPAMSGYLLSPLTVAATFLLPALAIGALALMRRWRYAWFFGLMLALTVLAMSFGFPQESRVGSVVTNLYYDSGRLQFLRTTYKAAPLAGLSIAILAGILLGIGIERLRRLKLTLKGRRVSSGWLWIPVAAVTALVVVQWGRPLWAGNAIDPRLVFSSVPKSWTDALADAQATTPADTRVAILPGELFAWYRWAGTNNSIAPGLSRKPVLIRQIVRSSPPLAAQLLESVDAQVQQGRLTPNQLPPLLQLMGVGRVLVPTDASADRNEALDPARAAELLAAQPGFRQPVRTFGPMRTFRPPAGRGGRTVRLPEVRAYAAPQPADPRITRVHPDSGASIVDGDADGLVSMAAVGVLDPRLASFYSGDLDRQAVEAQLARQATLVFTDSNRRNFTLTSRIAARVGQPLSSSEKIAREFPSYDPFPSKGAAGRTVAVYRGIRALTAPATPGFSIFPEHRPFAALDGRVDTTWIAQANDPADRWFQVDLARPLRSSAIAVRPHVDSASATRAIAISTNGGPDRRVKVRAGWNRIPVGPGPVRRIRIRAISRDTVYGLSPAGLDEVKIPGVKVEEALRLPTDLASAASGAELSRVPIRVVTERITADFPRRSGTKIVPAFSLDPIGMTDAEPGMRRIITLPVARAFSLAGWASLRSEAPDPAIDSFIGMGGGSRYSSSGRWEGLGAHRASSAFDDDPATAWVSEYGSGRPPWIQWSGSNPVTVRSLRLRGLPGRFLQPTRVLVSTPMGGFSLPVKAGGLVVLPAPVKTSRLRIAIVGVKRLPRALKLNSRPIAIALSEVAVSGIPVAHPRRAGKFESECGAIHLQSEGRQANLAVSGTVAALDAGAALRMTSCGPKVALQKGANLVDARPGELFAPDHLLLDGPAPAGRPVKAPAASISPGGDIRLVGPGWLVLGQSYSPGWRAWCRDGSGRERDLGEPVQADGYANGWPIDGASCLSARFSFGPQQAADITYVLSALIALALVAIVAASFVRRRRIRVMPPAQRVRAPADELAIGSTPGGHSALTVRSALPGAPEAGRRARLPRLLAATSAALVLITGAIYLINPDSNPQGINFDYPLHHEAAHWVALLAMILLLAASLVGVVSRRRQDKDGD